MTPPQAPNAALGRKDPLWLLVAATLGLLLARLFAAGYTQFFENDSISLAAGVATIVRDGGGDIYRYGPQLGYYQFVAALTRLAGGDLLSIPIIQVTLSAVAGAVIPLLGLLAFQADLTRMERWLVAATLAANPILWMASRYGSSAMVSVPLALGGLVILSNRPARIGEILGLALVGAAIIVRADAVLATPGVALLLWRNHGHPRPAAVRFALLGLFVAGIFALGVATDPRTHTLLSDVERHLASPTPTMFWDYLLWSVSPFPLIFAVLGLRDMLPARRWLFGILVAWSLPVMVFYFPATTQPRYFLLASLPLAMATAIGMVSLVNAAGKWRRLALAAVMLLGSVHLFVGLGWFTPRHRRSYLTEASIRTHTGPLWTGALLWKSYWNPGFSNAPILHPRFGAGSHVERSITAVFADLASGAQRDRHVLLLTEFGYTHLMHFYAQAAGVQIVGKADGLLWDRRFDMTLGGARLTTIGFPQLESDSTSIMPVAAGDGLWFLEREGPSLARVAERLPQGLILVADAPLPDAPRVWRFLVVPAR